MLLTFMVNILCEYLSNVSLISSRPRILLWLVGLLRRLLVV